MSNFIELRQSDMQAEMVAFAEGDGLAVITLADFLRIRTDSILTRERRIDREADGLEDPGPEYKQRVLQNAAAAAIESVGLDLYELYWESRVAPRNRDFHSLRDERSAADKYMYRSRTAGNQTPVTLVDSGANLLGFGIVVPDSEARLEATSSRFGRTAGRGQYITEGTLLAGFVKRKSSELSTVMAEGLLGVAANFSGGKVLAPHAKYEDNGVSDRLLELTDPVTAQTGKLIGVNSGANRILLPTDREVIKLAS